MAEHSNWRIHMIVEWEQGQDRHRLLDHTLAKMVS